MVEDVMKNNQKEKKLLKEKKVEEKKEKQRLAKEQWDKQPTSKKMPAYIVSIIFVVIVGVLITVK